MANRYEERLVDLSANIDSLSDRACACVLQRLLGSLDADKKIELLREMEKAVSGAMGRKQAEPRKGGEDTPAPAPSKPG